MRAYGFGLLELLVVLAVLGVALALLPPRLNPDGQALAQAGRALVSEVNRARLEALKQNRFVGLHFDPQGAGRNLVFVDEDDSRSFTPGDRVLGEKRFGEEPFGRVRLTTGGSLLFDPRGIPFGVPGLELVLENRTGSQSLRVRIGPQGRAEVVR